jgi:hypothetical protein
MSNLKAMSDTKEPKTVDVSALIAGDVQFVLVDVWTEAKGLHHVKLRVAEDVEDVAEDDGFKCGRCGWSALWEFRGLCDPVTNCPGCGQPIRQ